MLSYHTKREKERKRDQREEERRVERKRDTREKEKVREREGGG